jgi:hypothetical protein
MELGRDALVRRVYQNNSRVQLGVLSPRIKLNYEVIFLFTFFFGHFYNICLNILVFGLPRIAVSKNV